MLGLSSVKEFVMNAPVIDLLKRIANSHGHPAERDLAMASIYASVLQQPARNKQTRRGADRRRS